jgi:hypothetical protein
MKILKYILAAVGIVMLAFATFALSHWQKTELSYIPPKFMVFDGRDIKDGKIARWPEKGEAAIFCEKFLISFEGESWSEMEASLIRSAHQIDGRQGGYLPDNGAPVVEDMGNGVKSEYSPRQRTTTITFKNHRFVYCDYLNTLRADGQEYSTSQEPVQLWVSKKGFIQQIKP